MIVKNPNYKYEAKYVSKGTGRNDSYWTKFSVGDYDKKKKKATFIVVMAFFDMDLQDGDQVVFHDYQVGVHTYQGRQQATIYVREGDVEIVGLVNDGATVDITTDDLPFNVDNKDDLPF